MSLALIVVAQLTGYLPPPPPRKPITDPMFAGSPIRELRRQWDDCAHSVRQIVLMNSITDPNRAAGMLDFCAEYEDQLTGALVNRYGFNRANAAMQKARRTVELDLRNFALQVDAYVKSQPPPPPKPVEKPAYTVETNQTGCISDYTTGSGADERALLYVYDRKDDDRLDSRGKLIFAFRDPTLAQTLSANRKSLRFDLLITGYGSSQTRLKGLLGQAWLLEGRVAIMTNFANELESSMMNAQRVTLGRPTQAAHEFEASKFSQMVGDVRNCARKLGPWSQDR